MSIEGERTNFVSVIPKDLQLFDEADIPKVFQYLEKTFHLHKDWHVEFRKELQRIEGISDQEFFFRFTMQHLDPGLKRLLRRRDSVMLAVARYIIRDKLNAQIRDARAAKNFNRSGAWKRDDRR